EPPDMLPVRLDLTEFDAAPAPGDDPPLAAHHIPHADLRSTTDQPGLHGTPRVHREPRRRRDHTDHVARHDGKLPTLRRGEEGVPLVAFYSNGPECQQEYGC